MKILITVLVMITLPIWIIPFVVISMFISFAGVIYEALWDEHAKSLPDVD